MSQKQSRPEFAICVRNENHSASLELRKVYRVIPDADASSHSMVRVVDESGEDYLYPMDCFVSVELPEAAEAVFSDAR